MDPNANLAAQRAAAARVLKTEDECAEDGTFTPEQLQSLADDARELAALVVALANWIAAGGALPSEWTRAR